MSWAIGVDLPLCTPDAAAFVHFVPTDSTDETLASGEFAISGLGFGVPELEQGADLPATELDGAITVTSASTDHATGFMSGYARTALKSHVTQKSLGIEVEITALAF